MAPAVNSPSISIPDPYAKYDTWGVCWLVTRPDRNLLLVVHGPKGLSLPGGKPNEGETVFQAGVRELKEETGYVVTDEDKVEYADPGIADNEMKTYCLITNIGRLQGRLEESPEGVPYWAAPWTLVGQHARFPVYNRWLLNNLNIRYARYR